MRISTSARVFADFDLLKLSSKRQAIGHVEFCALVCKLDGLWGLVTLAMCLPLFCRVSLWHAQRLFESSAIHPAK